jgi:hypothetical protein
MAEVLLSFDAPVADDSGTYHARVVGRRADDGMWEGWLEFDPLDREGETLVGPVESRQPENILPTGHRASRRCISRELWTVHAARS